LELKSFLIFATTLLLMGCSGSINPAQPPPNKQYQGTSLNLSCPDEQLRSLLEPMIQVWSKQTGAVVSVSRDRMGADGTDVAILPYAELGEWADRGDLLPVPSALREPGDSYQWGSILEVYRGEPYAGWGSQVFALPVASEGSIVVYRADRFADPKSQEEFRKRFNRPLAAPASWEEFAEIAAFFAERDRRPSLPRIIADAARLEDLFLRVAACYDRPVRTGDAQDTPDALAFLFQLDSGAARVNAKGFAEAGRWLAALKAKGCVPAEGSADPAAALNEDRAVLAVASLADLMKLKRDDKRAGRYGLAALPGTKSFVNPATGTLTPSPVNTVPYLAGGWLAVVRRECKNPAAAFALLAELTGPIRSQELVAAGGFGPTRDTHLESDRLILWLGYGFDEARTKTLQDALRSNLGKSVRNPAFGLRTPDQALLKQELRGELEKIATGSDSPDAGLKRLADSWDGDRKGAPRAKLLEWRRRAAGVN